MGEIADMMLEGEMCAMCGDWLGGEALGLPGYCSEECANAAGMTLDDDDIPTPLEAPDTTACPKCGKRLKSEMGKRQHLRDKHGER